MAKTNNRLVRSLVEAARASGYSHGWSDRADRDVTTRMKTKEALEALEFKVAQALCRSDGLVWSEQKDPMTSGNGDNMQAAYLQSARVAISVILNRGCPISGPALVRKLAAQTEGDWTTAPNTIAPSQIAGGSMTWAQVLGLPRTRPGTIIVPCLNGMRRSDADFATGAERAMNRLVVRRLLCNGHALTTGGGVFKSWIVVGQMRPEEMSDENIRRVLRNGLGQPPAAYFP